MMSVRLVSGMDVKAVLTGGRSSSLRSLVVTSQTGAVQEQLSRSESKDKDTSHTMLYDSSHL